jgi:sucrose-6-phosphate hydrolase SacC (GH32 family)
MLACARACRTAVPGCGWSSSAVNGRHAPATLQLLGSTHHITQRLWHLAAGWINDPNAPLQYKGRTHLFFQYNPYKPAWGSIHWGHVVSEDLVTWRWLPPALQPDTWYDEGGVFSGSATITPEGTPVVLYTGETRHTAGAAGAGGGQGGR